MLPRSQSIFHLGEEACSLVGEAAMNGGGTTSRRGLREGLVVGLQILVHNQHQHHGSGSGSGHQQQQKHGRRHAQYAASIVLKQMVGPPPPRAAAARHGAVSSSFLKSCSLCRMELSYNKDVYMYRGDQGFCSEECRQQQILVDEAQEREVISKERRGLAQHHHHHTPIRGRPRKTLLAVA